MIARGALAALGLFLASGSIAAPETVRYERAPDAIRRIMNAPVTPQAHLNPGRTAFTLAWPERYRSIEMESRPFLSLAGLRVDPRSNALHRETLFARLAFQRVGETAPFFALGSRPSRRLGTFLASPDGARVAVALIGDDAVRLGIVDLRARRLAVVPGLRLNTVLGDAFLWTPDGSRVLVHALPPGAPPPAADAPPPGPVVEDSDGTAGGERTHTDLLRDARDEARFDACARSRLAYVDAVSLRVDAFGVTDLFERVRPSPDGAYLLADVLHRPFSHAVAARSFPRRTEIRTARGALLRVLADAAPADVPPGGAPVGPRAIRWRANAPAALEWIEARDGGDPYAVFAPVRDALVTLAAPFGGEPREVLRSERRVLNVTRVDGSPVELVQDYDPAARVRRTLAFDLSRPERGLRPVWSVPEGDRYADPGVFENRRASGDPVAYRSGNAVYLMGTGASREGNRPFVDRLDLTTLERTRVFRSELEPVETPLAVIDGAAGRFLTSRTSRTEPLDYVLREGEKWRALTAYPDPTPELRAIERRFVTYQRDDGVELSFMLYLPPGYRAGTPLPTLLWAYPREFANARLAGQVADTSRTLWTVEGFAPLMALEGYAVLDNVSMPVIGDAKNANDGYAEQVARDAQAAVRQAVALGVTDPNRVAVGGFSYGAAMTANLLASTHLFRAGIAMSGAYNRTLTPFGFQSERRTYWQAPQTYLSMSPFVYADRIREPLLLIHGMLDDNDGTFPLQSERFFAALRGNGATSRLVLLPGEAHDYAARESFETVLAEMVGWLDRYVKPAAVGRSP